MSRCIAKSIYLEKSKQLIICNGWSTGNPLAKEIQIPSRGHRHDMYDLLTLREPFAHIGNGMKKKIVRENEMNTGEQVLNRSRCRPKPLLLERPSRGPVEPATHPGRVPRCQLRAVWNSCSGRQSEPDGHRIAHRRMCINMRCCPGYYDDACSSRRMKQGLARFSSS